MRLIFFDFVQMAPQSAAVKVVGTALLLMAAIKLLFPSFVDTLQSRFQSLVLTYSQEQLVLIGFFVFAATYW